MSVHPLDHDVEQPQNLMDHIASSTMLMRINCNFPLFPEQILDEYYVHKMKHINPVVFIPTLFVYMSLLISQCGLIGLASYDGGIIPYVIRLIAVFAYFMCYLFCGLFCYFHFLRRTGRDHETFKIRLKKWYPFRMEDSMTVAGFCAWSLFLIARILTGQCPSDTTVWQEQMCNPFANQNGVPAGMIPTLYGIPLVAQLLMRCISIRVLVMCYILSFVVVSFCVFHTKSSIYASFPDLIIMVVFANSSFEVTRLQRLSYLDSLKSTRHEQMAIEQVKKEQKLQEVVQQIEVERVEERSIIQQLQLDRTEDEKRLKEAEVFQLRSLIGNVVHDLKTPLFAIEADLDMLKICHSYLPEDAVHDATARMYQEFNLVYILFLVSLFISTSPMLIDCFFSISSNVTSSLYDLTFIGLRRGRHN